MPQGRKAAQKANSSTDDRKRSLIQLDEAATEKLEKVAQHLGAEAGKGLGVVVELNRTSVVRSLIDKAYAGIGNNGGSEQPAA